MIAKATRGVICKAGSESTYVMAVTYQLWLWIVTSEYAQRQYRKYASGEEALNIRCRRRARAPAPLSYPVAATAGY